jgi:prepilin-type N-terminal cleavage/methylation domain-containing protein
MRSKFNGSESGYSLTELLVVVAIVGVLSLISVPAFINFKNQNTFRSDLRNFTNDLRAARQYAISQTVDVRVELDVPGNSLTSNTYRFYSSPDRGTTWNPLTVSGGHGITPGTNGNIKNLDGPVWIQSTAGPLLDIGSDGKPDLVYHPNGTMDLGANATTGTIVLQTAWKSVAFDTYTIVLSPSGQFTSTGSHS